jgi:hypothetical protein
MIAINTQKDAQADLLSIKKKLGIDPYRNPDEPVKPQDYISACEFIEQINPDNEEQLAFVEFRLILWNNLNAYTSRNEDHAMIKEFCIDQKEVLSKFTDLPKL